MKGIYVLPTEGKPIDQSIANASYISGYSVRVPWRSIEKAKLFDWSVIDNTFALASKYNKKIFLRILAGYHSPARIMNDTTIQKITYTNQNPNQGTVGQSVTIPKLWDSKYLEEYFSFLQKVASRFGNNTSLSIIAVSGAAVGSACPMIFNDTTSLSEWKAQGWTELEWYLAWGKTIDRTAMIFPNSQISLCIDSPMFYPSLARQLADYAVNSYGSRVCLQSNGLSSKIIKASEVDLVIRDFLDIFNYYNFNCTGFQMTDASGTRLGPLDVAIENGFRLGAKYLEIYQEDILNPNNRALLETTASRF